MNKEKTVLNYYITCNKLKNLIRSGWIDWNVQTKRLESVAEHVYSVQMLAIAMYYEFEYDIDILKVIFMLAIHELGESVIGDLTRFDITKEEKIEKEHAAVHKILKDIIGYEEIEKIFFEFDEGKTKEAKFAYQCDKLECDLQCKVYDELGYVDLNNQKMNNALENERVKTSLENGDTWSQMWLKFGQHAYPYDENFIKVSNYALENDILN